MAERPRLRVPGLLVALATTLLCVPAARADAIPVTGEANPALAPFDMLMTAFMRDHRVPGGVLAVGREGKVVYARGFGYADTTGREPVQPDALFRIASISKPITAVAVLQLAERGRLALDDGVFDLLGLGKRVAPDRRFDPRWKDVTIHHLLQHRGGWDRDKAFDPMVASLGIALVLGTPPPADQDAIIRYMLSEPLQFDPGEGFAYSNFGYCLLGRAIERVGGVSYEQYVQRQVLKPLGIRSMRLGRTLEADRAKGEVRYYARQPQRRPGATQENAGQLVDRPYGAWSIEAMDAHGGWIGSAADLVRFGMALDDPRECPVLEPASIETMFARPPGAAGFEEDGTPKPAYYACGWLVRPAGEGGRNTWHTGLLDGCSTLLVRRHDGLTWAVLFNSDFSADGEPLSVLIDPLLHRAANAVRVWPQ